MNNSTSDETAAAQDAIDTAIVALREKIEQATEGSCKKYPSALCIELPLSTTPDVMDVISAELIEANRPHKVEIMAGKPFLIIR